jgi:glycosyltransferase involved in cell wall biosynthesis
VSAEGSRLSACIVAMDEEDRIEACLASVAFCDEVLVVDSHSTDRTRELAAEAGARVVERDWPGMPAQRTFAIGEAEHDWVLCVDADERVTPELRAEIEGLRAAGFPGGSGDRAGWDFPRLTRYLGAWVRHGTWYPDRQLRLFDRRRARVAGHDPHDHVEVDGGVGHLAGDLEHHPYRSLADHLATIERYTTKMAHGMHERGRRTGSLDLLLRPCVRFLRFYVLRLGFLLGWRGLVLAYLAAHYVRLKYVKLRVLQEGGALE